MGNCMSCGGSAKKKMAKGGSTRNIYGIPQENIGTSSQYQPTAKKGAIVKSSKSKQGCWSGEDCPAGYYCGSGGTCLPQAKSPGTFSGPSVKLAGAIIGSGLAGMGRVLTADKRADKKATKKKVNETAKKITSNVMKKGGMVKNTKLASLAAPKNKITRADIIVGAKRNARKK